MNGKPYFFITEEHLDYDLFVLLSSLLLSIGATRNVRLLFNSLLEIYEDFFSSYCVNNAFYRSLHLLIARS